MMAPIFPDWRLRRTGIFNYHPLNSIDYENTELPDYDDAYNMEVNAKEDVDEFKRRFGRFNTSCLAQWIVGIDVAKADCTNKVSLMPDDIFVSFNYTKTLEMIYSVECHRIFHIHGSVDDCDSIQFGNPEVNSLDFEEKIKQKYQGAAFFETDIVPTAKVYSSLMEKFYKNISENISTLERALGNMRVDEVVVMGHNYREVDHRYYEEVFVPKFKNAKWTIYCWEKELNGVEKANAFFRENEIMDGATKTW